MRGKGGSILDAYAAMSDKSGDKQDKTQKEPEMSPAKEAYFPDQ